MMGESINRKFIIVDCSYTSSLFMPDEDLPNIDQNFQVLLEKKVQIVVPQLWKFETGNVLLSAIVSGRINKKQLNEILILIEQLPIVETPLLSFKEIKQIVSLANINSLSFSDASYLFLAIDQNLDLATLDKKLISAANKVGVSIF